MSLRNLLPILTLLTLGACKYDLEKITYTPPEPPSADGFNVILIDNDSSQTVIYKRTEFTYGLTNTSKYDLFIEEVSIAIDGNEIRKTNASFGESISFSIDPESLSDGVHALSITTKALFSGSNLASLTNTQYILEQQWPIMVDKTPEPVEIKAIEVVDGELIVYIDSMHLRNYDDLYLVKSSGGDAVKVPKDANQLTYPYFLDGELELELRTITEFDLMSIGPVYRFELNEDWVNFVLQDSSVVLQLKRPALHKNVYSFTAGDESFQGFPADTVTLVLEENLTFGSNIEYGVHFRYGPEGTEYKSFRQKLGLGLDVPEFDNIIYDQNTDAYFLINQDEYAEYPTVIYKLDSDLNVIDSVTFTGTSNEEEGHIDVSPNGSTLCYLNESSTLFMINPLTMQVSETHDLSAIINDWSFVRRAIKVTDDNLLFVRGGTYDIVDLSSGALLFSGGGRYGFNGDFAPDGKYVYNDGKVYERVGDTYTELYEIDPMYKQGLAIDAQRMLRFGENFAEIITFSSGTGEGQFAITNVEALAAIGPIESIDVDVRTASIISFLDEGFFEVYDYDGNLKYKKQLYQDNDHFADKPYQYKGQYLSVGDGKAIKIIIE